MYRRSFPYYKPVILVIESTRSGYRLRKYLNSGLGYNSSNRSSLHTLVTITQQKVQILVKNSKEIFFNIEIQKCLNQ